MANEAQDALRAQLPYSHAFIRASVGASRATLRGVVEWRYQKEQAELAVRAATLGQPPVPWASYDALRRRAGR